MAGNKTTPKSPVDTGNKTISGRTIWNDPETGKDYSERSTTFEIDGKYYTMPTVAKNGGQYTSDTIRDYVKENGPIDYITGEKLPEFRNREDAIEYAISRSSTRKKPKAGMSEGGSVEDQTEEGFGLDALVGLDKPVNRVGGLSKKNAPKPVNAPVGRQSMLLTAEDRSTLADLTPIVGDLKGAYETVDMIADELAREEPNYYVIGAMGGIGVAAAIVGLFPGLGDAGAKAMREGAKSLGDVAKRIEVDTSSMGSGLGNVSLQPKNKKELPPAENSAKTQIAGTLPTYKKADTLLTELAGEGKTLDFGAGLGLSKKELGFDTYEPFPKGDFNPDFVSPTDIPDNTYKKVTNLNVLNVVPRSTRDNIVKDIGRILKPDGRAVITTRGRDVLSAKGTSGPEPMSIITSMDTYQKGFTQPELRSYITDTLGEGFEVTNNKLGAAGVTVHKLNTKNFNEGGAVTMDNQMRMFEEGGIADDGMSRDPVSGNEIPPGSLAREVRDDVPAQLSDGEYVVPADVVRFFGVKYFEDLRMVAKQGLQQMEQDGRIGGEPMGSPAPQSADDALSPEEEALLQEIMAMEQQPQQQPPMQQQPQPSMAVGGVVKAAYGISVGGGDNYTRDIAIGGNKPKVTTGTDTGTTTTTTTGKDGMTSVFYIHPDGRRVKVLLLNGKPVGKVPDDFLDFVTDTPENRVKINFQVAEETPVGTGTGTTSSSQDNQDERREPGGNLYQEPEPKTFEDIGINGSDPAAGADAALTQSAGLIMEGFTAIAPIGGAVIDSIRQAELISIAHANALFADRQKPLEDGTSVVGNQIRAQIE